MHIKQRLESILQSLNITQKAFALSIDVSPGNVSDWLSNKRNISPSLEALARISEVYKINLNWLLTGEGEMFLIKGGFSNKNTINCKDAMISESAINYKESEKIKKLEAQIEELKKNIAELEKDNSDLDRQVEDLKQDLIDNMKRLLSFHEKLTPQN